MQILSIDTSRNKQSMTVFNTEANKFISHSLQAKSSFFVADLINILDKENISPQDISLIATTSGPGSFTGIRTGISIVKTLASELDLKIFVANNFELIRYEKKFTGPFAIQAGLNDYYISLNDEYHNPEKNFFSYERGNFELLDFADTTIVSELLIQLFLEKQSSNPTLVSYRDLKPYYLREPSIGKK